MLKHQCSQEQKGSTTARIGYRPGIVAVGIGLSLVSVLAKPDYSANCLECHSARTGRMELIGHDTTMDLGSGTRKVYQVKAGEAANVQLDVLNGGGKYGLSVFFKSATGVQDSGNSLSIPVPGSPWSSGSDYYYKTRTSSDQTWTLPVAVGAGTPADFYPFEAQIGIDSGGLRAQAEQFYIQVTADTPVNTAPVLAVIPDQSLGEMLGWSASASATDSDVPVQTLTYSLGAGAPTGLGIDPVTGGLTWTPTEEQGPASYPVSITVTDDGTPPLSDAKTFTITVEEVNRVPQLGVVADQTTAPGSTVAFMAMGSDDDIPAQTLTYSLGAGAPAGASIDSATGEFSWAVPAGASAGTQVIEITVSDSSVPVLSASRSVNITVEVTAVEPPRVSPPQAQGDAFGLAVITAAGRNYILEYKDALSDGVWTALAPVAGDGTEQTLVDPTPGIGQRFYRVRVE